MSASLFATSDLHVSRPENRRIVEELVPESGDDWLIVAGDVADLSTDIEWCLRLLRERFARVIWAPGNHELWTLPADPLQVRGVERYQALVEMCRRIDVLTPEDDFAVWRGAGGPAVVVPIFQLYDYSWRMPGQDSKEESLKYAYRTGIVCTDEMVLHSDPYPHKELWCRDRIAQTEQRLAALDPDLPAVLVSHWPLVRQPTDVLWYPEFAQWCGTDLTADWHLRFRAAVAVYGHLHIPRTTEYDGVRFEEVSLGYPHEWGKRATPPQPLRRVFP
ncbi:metallophosphoesterase family protein [Paractinoplanes rishiriensis]|uniref:metallophosphoesterase family protein n=1 Tax=Paractinoplanes rishiriensis TaxID=1050105 RepID=UPI001EF1D5AF|nr:metallophosphoesterase [Actinoplanes rishiriensis]